MATLRDWVSVASRRLVQAGIQPRDAAFDVEVLARHALGWTRAQWLSRLRDDLPGAPGHFSGLVDPLIERRYRREPVAHITGVREFWGLDMTVTADVLSPRPETELLVEIALSKLLPRSAPWAIADVGTGSGCLAVALARELPQARLTATDLSAAALTVAERNAQRHGVQASIAFRETRFLDGSPGPYDLIVSNPPYIPEHARTTLTPEVARYEPAVALFGGMDGLDPVRALLPIAAMSLRPGGWLVMEIGVGHSEEVRQLASEALLSVEEIRPDLQGIPRAVVMRLATE
ncbi:MAG: peptide chain release factor N(5)-glutamine methyltransferase [Acidobacteria bacterium]|nr:peptide chain release factor N(5)-glutamine methyltransferase [Acidobacteriota bacterium]